MAALVPLGILDRYQLAGVVASWWGDAAFETEGEENVRDKQRLAAPSGGKAESP